MRVDRLGGACAVLLAAAIGCTKDATQIIVVVDSDLRVGEEITVVRAAVVDTPGAPPRDTQDFRMELRFPFSFGVVPNEEGDDEVLIVLEARGPIDDGPEGTLFEQRTLTSFIEEKTLLLEVDLLASCLTASCDPPDTCREGRCQPELYDSSLLEEVEPGDELVDHMRPRPRDAGVAADSGVPDSGVPDSGNDPMDASVAMDAAVVMDSGVAADSGMGPGCSTTPDCDQPGKCPPNAQDCICLDTMMGMNCVPTCSASNTSCPVLGNGQATRCDTNMMICVPD
jgi:hypothetical protein